MDEEEEDGEDEEGEDEERKERDRKEPYLADQHVANFLLLRVHLFLHVPMINTSSSTEPAEQMKVKRSRWSEFAPSNGS